MTRAQFALQLATLCKAHMQGAFSASDVQRNRHVMDAILPLYAQQRWAHFPDRGYSSPSGRRLLYSDRMLRHLRAAARLGELAAHKCGRHWLFTAK